MRRHVSWRDRARPIIAAVLKETAGQSEKAIRRALYEAYPFHERAMYPYNVWCDEVRRQRGLKGIPSARKTLARRLAENQRDLFEEAE